MESFAKSYDQIDSLVNAVYTLVYSKDIRMEFGIKKCGVSVLKRGTFDKAKIRRLNLPNKKLMKTIQ